MNKKYVVCISSCYVRDTQAKLVFDENDNEDSWRWVDVDLPAFVSIVKAENKESAIKLVAESKGYNEKSLEAYET